MANSQEKQKFTETIPEEIKTLDLLHKDYTNCLTDGQSLHWSKWSKTFTVVKDLKRNQKEKRRMVFQQIGNINKDIEFINKNQIEILELKSTLTEIFKVYQRCSTPYLSRLKNQKTNLKISELKVQSQEKKGKDK